MNHPIQIKTSRDITNLSGDYCGFNLRICCVFTFLAYGAVLRGGCGGLEDSSTSALIGLEGKQTSSTSVSSIAAGSFDYHPSHDFLGKLEANVRFHLPNKLPGNKILSDLDKLPLLQKSIKTAVKTLISSNAHMHKCLCRRRDSKLY